MSVPLYEAEADFFRMLGHPAVLRGMPAGRNELLTELREAEAAAR